MSSNALRFGAIETSYGFSTASLDLKKKQKEKGEEKQHKKVMEGEDEREDTRSPKWCFSLIPQHYFHVECSCSVVYQTKDVPHFRVVSLPLICFLARRRNWTIARAIGSKFQRILHKETI